MITGMNNIVGDEAKWGAITGNMSDQTDLAAALSLDYSSTPTVNTAKLSSSSVSTLVRWGKVCVMSMYLKGTNALARNDVLFTLPDNIVSARNQWATAPSKESGVAIDVVVSQGEHVVKANAALTAAQYDGCEIQLVFIIF